MPVVGGHARRVVLLVGVYVAINRFGVRLPLKPFFAVTSAFLYYMAFVFAGKGIAELQEGGFVSLTPVRSAPRVARARHLSDGESLTAQGLLVVLALVALVGPSCSSPGARSPPERATRSGEAVASTPTPDLCDHFGDRVQVAEPLFRDFGGRPASPATIETLRVFEDNALVRRVLEAPGRGRVLVVDGEGSLPLRAGRWPAGRAGGGQRLGGSRGARLRPRRRRARRGVAGGEGARRLPAQERPRPERESAACR